MPEPIQPQLTAAPHGGPGAQQFAGLDFSVNSNPFGPNPVLVRDAQQADPAAYPDPHLRLARTRLAEWHGLEPAQVVLAVGASELLHRLARAYLRPGSLAVTLGPAFGEFSRAVALQRAELQEIGLADVERLETLSPTLVYLSRPNNPLGVAIELESLTRLADICLHIGALLILDEAYAPLRPELLSLPHHPACLRLHSPGKLHGVVGLRPAYALAPRTVAAALTNLAPAWPLPAAQVAVLEALPDASAFVEETLPRWQREAANLAAALNELAPVSRHELPFFTLNVGNAARISKELFQRSFKVRDCASYGSPQLIRISARVPEDNLQLIQALKEVLSV